MRKSNEKEKRQSWHSARGFGPALRAQSADFSPRQLPRKLELVTGSCSWRGNVIANTNETQQSSKSPANPTRNPFKHPKLLTQAVRCGALSLPLSSGITLVYLASAIVEWNAEKQTPVAKIMKS